MIKRLLSALLVVMLLLTGCNGSKSKKTESSQEKVMNEENKTVKTETSQEKVMNEENKTVKEEEQKKKQKNKVKKQKIQSTAAPTQTVKKKSSANKKKMSSASHTGKIKGNRKSKIYHVDGSSASYNKIKEENVVWFNSEEEAKKAGYRRAKR
ncbi:hypothetical protein [Eggerthia catenaformis]|uniref:sunset domain-containing protein n=1 Tax=Eggerthia catenaformis TaxID=31973 RepID=UPI000686F078|nr:hypothetical protein [Eggerthia catenaformis]